MREPIYTMIFAVDARHLVNHAKVNRGTILPLHQAYANTLQDKLQRLGVWCNIFSIST